MIIEQTFAVNASHEQTVEFFSDIQQVGSCIPGVEGVRETEPGQYEATLAVRLGPIRAAFKGSVSLDEGQAPARLKASGEGRDRATGSIAKVDFTADLSEDQPGVTTVCTVADLAIRGKLAQFGTGVMKAAAGEIVQEFAACANAKLVEQALRAERAPEADSGGHPQTVAGSETNAAPAMRKQRGVVSILFRGLVRSFGKTLRRAADWIETRLDQRGTRQ